MPKNARGTGNSTIISGSNGDDVLYGFGGSYTLVGGKGNDTYYVDDSGDSIIEKNNGGIDLVISSIDWTLGDQLENLTLSGSGDLAGTGNDLDNVITGTSGANIIWGLAGDDTLIGGAGNDTLIGGDGADVINGGSDIDTAVFSGQSTEYVIERSGDELHVTSGAGVTDILRNVEYLSFDDALVAASDIGAPQPDPPQAVGDTASGVEDTALVIPVLSNDLGDAISVTSVTAGAIGSVSVNDDGTVTYLPAADANGTDSFTYTITDSAGRTSTASVSVAIAAVNDAPVAAADNFSAPADAVFTSTGSVLSNDSDVEGDPLRVIGAGAASGYPLDVAMASGSYAAKTAAGGSVQINADGTFSYSPAAGFSGTDSFNYTISDGNGGQAAATVTLEVGTGSAPPYYVDGLIYGDPYRLNYPDHPGTAMTVTYSFLSSVPDYYGATNLFSGSFLAFTEEQQQATRDILALIEKFTDLTFVETSTADAGITFGLANLTGYNGLAYKPSGDGVGSSASDVWLDSDHAGTSFSPGSQAYATLLHELGHALGLDHPTLPTVEENQQYTIMAALPHPSFPETVSSYQLYDVAALQYLYGANSSFGAGDDTFDFAALDSRTATIWDGGGHDLIDMSAATHAVDLDLSAGAFSTVAASGTDNIAIAFGTTIEDAIGGAYDDHIAGNQVANAIEGGAGDDTLSGGGGPDTFIFGANWGKDVITDFVHGEDRLDFTKAGLALSDLHISSSGADTVITHGNDSIVLEGVHALDASDLLLA